MGMMTKEKIIGLLFGAGLMTSTEADAMYVGPKAKGWEKISNKFSNLMDKMERAEISDTGAKIIDWKEPEEGVMRLREIMSHPQLFENYPSLQHIKVKEGGSGGSWSGWGSGSGQRTIRVGEEGDPRPTLLHEVQHAIQEKEGWARGGNVDQFRNVGKNTKVDLSEIDASLAFIDNAKAAKWKEVDIIDPFSGEFRTISSEYIPQWESVLREQKKLAESHLQRLNIKRTPEETYRSLSGEIEARDTAARMGLSTARRQSTSPYSGQGIPLKDTITKMGVAAPVGAILAEQLAQKRAMAQKYEGGGLEEAVNPVEYLIPGRLGGGMMNMGIDSLMKMLGL